MITAEITFRRARRDDIKALRVLHRASMHALGREHYTWNQISGRFASLETVDPDMIDDGTYFVAECEGDIVGSGGYGLGIPAYDPFVPSCEPRPCGRRANIRSVFGHPAFIRRGIGRTILDLSESEAVMFGGVECFELIATLPGVPLYLRNGYHAGGTIELPLKRGTIPGVFMWKMVAENEAVQEAA